MAISSHCPELSLSTRWALLEGRLCGYAVVTFDSQSSCPLSPQGQAQHPLQQREAGVRLFYSLAHHGPSTQVVGPSRLGEKDAK